MQSNGSEGGICMLLLITMQYTGRSTGVKPSCMMMKMCSSLVPAAEGFIAFNVIFNKVERTIGTLY